MTFKHVVKNKHYFSSEINVVQTGVIIVGAAIISVFHYSVERTILFYKLLFNHLTVYSVTHYCVYFPLWKNKAHGYLCNLPNMAQLDREWKHTKAHSTAFPITLICKH